MTQAASASRAAIEVQGLGKRYRLGTRDDTSDTLAGTLAGWVRAPLRGFRRLRGLTRFSDGADTADTIWALRDVSFQVREGEAVGIIGRNGAGKSTLLKILSRITVPTTGRAVLRGRVASLLEVGTGFHHELTGRENIYLNGTLLGMTRREINGKLEEIVEFSDVRAFLDTPIKRYSSGMQVRLAFAVAAHLEPEVLVIDEVLAVGDAEFQRKCLGKMSEVASQGRTVLFVSHNLTALETLCPNVLWLEAGRVLYSGPAREGISRYMASVFPQREGSRVVDFADSRRGLVTLGSARLTSVEFRRLGPQTDDESPWSVCFGEEFAIDVCFKVDTIRTGVVIGLSVKNDRGEDVLTSHSTDIGAKEGLEAHQGHYRATVSLGAPWLRPGEYVLEFAVISGLQLLDHIPAAVRLTVEERASVEAPYLALKKGPVSPMWLWRIEETRPASNRSALTGFPA